MTRDAGGVLAPWTWIVFVVVASLLLSRTFACATPFAALATLAAMTLRDRHAVTLVLAAWLGNQAIGFGLLHYPWTATTLGWGAAIGMAALAAWVTARGIWHALSGARLFGIGIGLAGACAAYEVVLFAATAILPSGPGAFAPAVVAWIFTVNAVALALLLTTRRLATTIGVPASSGPVSPRA